MRKQYRMTPEQLTYLLDACKPVPAMMLQCGPTPTQQDNANRAWQKLGDDMGFHWYTALPAGSDPHCFTAEPK